MYTLVSSSLTYMFPQEYTMCETLESYLLIHICTSQDRKPHILDYRWQCNGSYNRCQPAPDSQLHLKHWVGDKGTPHLDEMDISDIVYDKLFYPQNIPLKPSRLGIVVKIANEVSKIIVHLLA